MNKTQRLLEIEKVRNNLARDLHDDIGSTLSSINILSKVALSEKNGNVQHYLQRIGDQSARIMEDIGDMVWSVNPHNDAVREVIAHMREFASEILETNNIDYEIKEKISPNVKLTPEQRKNLFLIFKEAVNNAAKYSHAKQINITLAQTDRILLLSIQDNGDGFNEQQVKSGNGLRNQRERAAELNGKLTIKSEPGEGTLVALEIPIAWWCDAHVLKYSDIYGLSLMAYTVLLYEDNLLLRESILAMLRLNKDIEVAGAFENPLEVSLHLHQYKPDLVIMDIDMPHMNGIQAVDQVRKNNKEIPVLMLTVFDDNQHVFDAICAGASGYLLKKHISSRLFLAIEEVMEGGAPMSPSIARMVLASMQQKVKTTNPYELTVREQEVLASLSRGNSYKLIAAEFAISMDTVRSHIKKIYEKLHVHSQTEAVSKAINERLI